MQFDVTRFLGGFEKRDRKIRRVFRANGSSGEVSGVCWCHETCNFCCFWFHCHSVPASIICLLTVVKLFRKVRLSFRPLEVKTLAMASSMLKTVVGGLDELKKMIQYQISILNLFVLLELHNYPDNSLFHRFSKDSKLSLFFFWL